MWLLNWFRRIFCFPTAEEARARNSRANEKIVKKEIKYIKKKIKKAIKSGAIKISCDIKCVGTIMFLREYGYMIEKDDNKGRNYFLIYWDLSLKKKGMCI